MQFTELNSVQIQFKASDAIKSKCGLRDVEGDLEACALYVQFALGCLPFASAVCSVQVHRVDLIERCAAAGGGEAGGGGGGEEAREANQTHSLLPSPYILLTARTTHSEHHHTTHFIITAHYTLITSHYMPTTTLVSLYTCSLHIVLFLNIAQCAMHTSVPHQTLNTANCRWIENWCSTETAQGLPMMSILRNCPHCKTARCVCFKCMYREHKHSLPEPPKAHTNQL